MKLSPHFTLAEFTRSDRARAMGLTNNPPPFVVDNLTALCLHVLEPLRAIIGPIRILSGYRSPALNDATPGSSERSQHIKGEAADIEAIDLAVSNEDVARNIERHIPEWDQLIREHLKDDDPKAGWNHVSFVRYPGRNRRMVLRHGKR